MIKSIQELLALREITGSKQQICGIASNEAEAIEWAVLQAAKTNCEGIVVGRSVEDKRIIIVDGPTATICCIPITTGYLEGMYEIVTGQQKQVYRDIQFDDALKANTPDILLSCAHKATTLLYDNGGLLMYEGDNLTEDNMRKLENIYIFSDGTVWDDTIGRKRAHIQSVKYKHSNYKRVQVAVQIGNDAIFKLHRLVFAAYQGMPLDILNIMTRRRSDWCKWYFEASNFDVSGVREIREYDDKLLWSVDHIDGNTGNNDFTNLQLCTAHTNTTMRIVRNSGFRIKGI